MFKTNRNTISFRCAHEDRGVIAEPTQSKAFMPDWFKRLPPVDTNVLSATNNGLTVKRCMPFVDAMTTGFILPLASTVRLEVRDGGATVDAGWEFDKPMVSPHGANQVAGHPNMPRPPCKFHNYWTIETPRGWSCLFLPPLNRSNPAFEIVVGIVDTDTYKSLIHFPFFATGQEGVHTIEKGTPIAQIIPFRRDVASVSMSIETETQAQAQERELIRRNTLASAAWYRRISRAQR